MKNTLAFLLASALLLTACSNDNNEGNSLSVVKSNVIFNAASSTGYVVMNEAGTFTATTDADWCTVNCKDDSVLVTVSNNTAIDGRSALLIINNGEQKQIVPITQCGGYFRMDNISSKVVKNDASTFTFKLDCSFDCQLTTSEPWLSITNNHNGTATVNIDKNNDATPRFADITILCSALNQSNTINVSQYDVKDLMGEWTATFTSLIEGVGNQQRSQTINLSMDGNNIELKGLFEDDNLVLKGETKGDNFLFPYTNDLFNGHLFGLDLYARLLPIQNDGTPNFCANNEAGLVAVVSMEDGKLTCRLTDNGKVGETVLSGVYLFPKGEALNSDNNLGIWSESSTYGGITLTRK